MKHQINRRPSRKTTEVYRHGIGNAEREAMRILEQGGEKVSHEISHAEPVGCEELCVTD
ncbi:MAG: hypothetical protein O7A06_06605 [Acidobacteria bacterium]|nr:hypothetical protein [Acidobacteriota bacterium]